MDVEEGLIAGAFGAAAHQGGVAAAGRLPDVHKEPQARHLAQHRMVVGGLMRITPAPAFQIGAPAFDQRKQGLIQRDAGDVCARLDRSRLDHVTPDRSPADILVDPFKEQRLGMGESIGERADLVACEPVLQGAQPGLGNQRFGHVFVHLAVPFGQKGQRALAQPFGCAVGCGLAGEPQIGTDQRQNAARGRRDGVKLRLDKAVAGMNLARGHQRQPTLHTLGIAPVKRDMVGEGPVHGLVVGIANDARGRVQDLGVGGIGLHACPTVLAFPSGGWHPALGNVGSIAHRHRANGLKRDRRMVGQRQVLAWGHEELPGRHRLGDRLRRHQPQARGHRGICARKGSPLQGRHRAGWGDRGQVVMAARQDRPAFAPSLNNGDRRLILDGDDGLGGAKRFWAFGRQIFLGVGGIDLFDDDVLIIDIGRGQAPAHLVRPADQHQRHARDGAADHPAGGQFQPREIPDRRRSQAKVRVIGQKAATCGRAAGKGGKGVRRTGKAARDKGRQGGIQIGHGAGVRNREGAGHQAGIGRQRDDALRRIVWQNIGQTRRGKDLRQLGALHLGLQVRGHLQRHQLDDRDGIGRGPGRDLVGKEKEFRRPAAARPGIHLGDPGIDPGRIGLKRGLGPRILRRDRLQRQLV